MAIAASSRRFLETVWPDWQETRRRQYGGIIPAVMSDSTCGRSSTFLREVVHEAGLTAEVRHGWFHFDGPEGTMGSSAQHAWVVSRSWVLDITADQFGADEIIVTQCSDCRYRSGTDAALPEFQLRRAHHVSEIWGRWLSSPMRQKLFCSIAPTFNRAFPRETYS